MTLIVELKSYSCDDIENIDQWVPNHKNIIYDLHLTIGFANETWGESYKITVATPGGLSNLMESHPFFNNINKYIIINHYSWSKVQEIINNRLSSIEIFDFYDWQDINEQLQQAFNGQ